MLVYAFVTSHIDFYNSLLHGLPNIQIAKIQRVLNASARLVCNVYMAISVLSIPCGTVKRTCIAITSVWFFGFTLNATSFSLDNEDLPKL